MNTKKLPCPICQTESDQRERRNDNMVISCPKCGRFEATYEFLHFHNTAEYESKLYLVQGILRERTETGLLTILFAGEPNNENGFRIDDLLVSINTPKTPDEKASRILLKIKKLTGDTFGAIIRLDPDNDHPLAYCKNKAEFGNILYLLQKLGYIDHLSTGMSCRLTIEGWRKATELESDELKPEEEVQQNKPTKDPKDFFICHASEDKKAIVEPLIERLEHRGLSYWYDKGNIKLGDNLVRKINEGLQISKYVIVLISKDFIAKEWPQIEFEAALSQEINANETRVLPVLIGDNKTINEIKKKFPLLASKVYAKWEEGLDSLVPKLEERIQE